MSCVGQPWTATDSAGRSIGLCGSAHDLILDLAMLWFTWCQGNHAACRDRHRPSAADPGNWSHVASTRSLRGSEGLGWQRSPTTFIGRPRH
jgi:hypothetical protein